MAQWLNNKELFQKELITGTLWQCYVAEMFRQKGFDVLVPNLNLIVGKINDDGESYINSKDLLVDGNIIEVKSRNLEFSCNSDFPFETVFIDTRQGYDAKTDKPVLYVCVSQKTGAIITLDVGKSFKHWKVERTWDSVRKINLVAYVCHRDIWMDIDGGVAILRKGSERGLEKPGAVGGA